jgi:hypothetical protein
MAYNASENLKAELDKEEGEGEFILLRYSRWDMKSKDHCLDASG